MITANDVLFALVDDPTESGLGDFLASHHASQAITWLPDPLDLDHLDVIGTALIITEDGLLCIPYTLVDPDSGWEQLDLSAAFLLPEPRGFREAEQRYTQAEHELTQLLRRGLDQARPVTL